MEFNAKTIQQYQTIQNSQNCNGAQENPKFRIPKMINWNNQNVQNRLYLVKAKENVVVVVVVENVMIYCFKTKKIGFDTLTDFH